MSDVLRYGVPRPEMFEAPSALLTRLVAAQGCSLDEMLEFLHLDDHQDVDWDLADRGFEEFRRRCNLAPQDFAVAELLLGNMQRAELDAERYLLYAGQRRPRFRYCPSCIASRREPYFDIHWRFADWRLCPIHKCLMEETCANCTGSITHPRCMFASGAGRKGHFTLKRCLRCTAKLSDVRACPISQDTKSLLKENEHCWLRNGRALLAALVHGRFKLGDDVIALKRLDLVDRKGGFATDHQWTQVEQRLRSNFDTA